MRLLLRFHKLGALSWISHLDTLRTMEKALRRAKLPLALTQGFNPHPKMSFAIPLAVGVASQGDYLELELQQDLPLQQVVDSLNTTLPGELQMRSANLIPPKAPALMALAAFSQYRLKLPQDDATNWQTVCQDLMAEKQIMVQRQGKGGVVNQLEIRPGLLHLAVVNLGEELYLEATWETSSRLFIRLGEVIEILARSGGVAPWSLAISMPLRLDIGVKEGKRFLSLEEYFPLVWQRYAI